MNDLRKREPRLLGDIIRDMIQQGLLTIKMNDYGKNRCWVFGNL